MRRVVWVHVRWLVFAVLGISSLQGCSGNGGQSPAAAPPAQPATGAPSPTPPALPDPPAPPPPSQPPSSAPAIAPIADVTCDGRKALGLANAKMESAAPVAQRRAVLAIQCDTYDIMARISSLGGSATQIQAWHDRTRDLAARAIDAVKSHPVESSRLPLSESHRRMYEVAAEVEQSADGSAVLAWPTNPWRPLKPLQRPDSAESSALTAALMRGERRSVALNLRSSYPGAKLIRVSLDIPESRAGSLQLYQINWTGNDLSDWAAAELEPLGDATAPRELSLLPGVTQQLLIQVTPERSGDAGRFVGAVVLTAESQAAPIRIPLDVTVFTTQLPQRPSFNVAGWDYADSGPDPRYSVTASNRLQLIDHLSERYVDSAWGHGRTVLHWRQIGPDGNLTAALDSKSLQTWLSEWQHARRFRVLLHAKNGIATIPETDPSFPAAVATWARAWAAEIRRLGRSPDEFDISVIDEPSNADMARTIVRWSQAIRASGAGFRIWTDPIWPVPELPPQSLIDAVDRVALQLRMAESGGEVYWNWARTLSQQGKIVELYACEGPARRLDPYGYYRLTAWRGFFIGGAAVSYWSLSYTGESRSDNEFAAGIDSMQPYNYSPLFINGSQVRGGKQMEALAEGIQDMQYLHMLRAAAESQPLASARERAQNLLAEAERFVATAPRMADAQWRNQIDSSEADRHIVEIGHFLDSL